MPLKGNDISILTARFGCARFGASRFGFIPCPEDVEGSGTTEPGEYIWKEVAPPVTDWTLVGEDCVCRNLCTLALGTITLTDATPQDNESVTASVTLSGVLGQVDGIARINWGDGRHDEQMHGPLVNGTFQFTGHYHNVGSYTITITITDERGCEAVAQTPITVVVPGTLAVTFVMDPDPLTLSIDSSTPITFTPTVTPGVAPYTYNWNFGDGSADSTDEIPVHTFSNPGAGGTYTVTLTVTDADAEQAQHQETFDIAGV